jgi:hypothetical protein
MGRCLEALGAGLADLRHRRRLWPGLYAAQAVLALLLVLPVWAGLDAQLAHRPFAAARLAGGDLGLLDELLGALQGTGAALKALLPVVLLLGYLVRLFLLGGALRALASPASSLSTEEFLASCGRSFMPLGRLAAVFAVGHLAALGTIGGLGYAASRWTDGVLWPMAPEVGVLAAALPGLLLWLVVATAHDYARAAVVLAHQSGAPAVRPHRRALVAVRAVALEDRTRLSVHLTSLALGLVVLFLGAGAARYAGAAGPLWLAASGAFLLRQVTTFLRTGVHLARYRSVLLLSPPMAAPPALAAAALLSAPAEELVTM